MLSMISEGNENQNHSVTHCTCTRTAEIKRKDRGKCDEDVEKLQLFCTAGGMKTWCSHWVSVRIPSLNLLLFLPVKIYFYEKVNIFLVALVTHTVIKSDCNFLDKYFFNLKKLVRCPPPSKSVSSKI